MRSRISDVQGTVRALKYTLDHPLVFRDHHVRLDREQIPYEPQAKVCCIFEGY